MSPFVTGKDGKPLAKNPFRDLRVRKAISKAINRPAIASRVMEGQAIPSGQLVSEKLFGHNPALKPEAYDPDGAKKLLAEAGYPNGFNITIHGPAGRYVNDEKIVQAVAQMLSRVGITAKVERQVVITLEGADRELLGQVAAAVRELRPPEPYKGKGVKYAEETIRRKAGKAAGAGAR